METRNIKVTLEKAKEWYRSGNLILLELALQAFTKKELETHTYEEITWMVGGIDIPKEQIVLETLAAYYKKDTDKFCPNQEKYFIGKTNHYDGWAVIKHTSVMYPGIAYYLREEDAKEALGIFLEEMKYENK